MQLWGMGCWLQVKDSHQPATRLQDFDKFFIHSDLDLCSLRFERNLVFEFQIRTIRHPTHHSTSDP